MVVGSQMGSGGVVQEYMGGQQARNTQDSNKVAIQTNESAKQESQSQSTNNEEAKKEAAQLTGVGTNLNISA